MYEYKNWRPWRYVTASDTLLTSYEPSNFPAYVADKPPNTSLDTAATLIQTKELTAIMVKAYGTDAANEDAQLVFTGWMQDGPGTVLLEAKATLGAHTWSNEAVIRPPYRNDWPTTGAVYEADTWVITRNASCSHSERSAVDETSYLVIQTVQFRYLMCQIKLDGGDVTSSSFGLIWRELA